MSYALSMSYATSTWRRLWIYIPAREGGEDDLLPRLED